MRKLLCVLHNIKGDSKFLICHNIDNFIVCDQCENINMSMCQKISLLLLLCISFCVGQVFNDDLNAPKLHPTLDQHIVPVQENFTLSCAGKFELEWVFPTLDYKGGDPAMKERVQVTQEVKPGENARPHVSHLNLYSLVTFFSCICCL